MVADIPGLIEGAAEGHGLGHQFLRHLERTKILLHIIDIAPMDGGTDPIDEAKKIINELKKYSDVLFDKPRWIILNKIDLDENFEQLKNKIVQGLNWHEKVFCISALSGRGCKEVTYEIMNYMEKSDEDDET